MRVFRRALMGAEQPPLGQRRNLVYGGKQLAGLLSAGSSRPLAAPVVDVAELLQSAIALPAVGYDPAYSSSPVKWIPQKQSIRAGRARSELPVVTGVAGARLDRMIRLSCDTPTVHRRLVMPVNAPADVEDDRFVVRGFPAFRQLCSHGKRRPVPSTKVLFVPIYCPVLDG